MTTYRVERIHGLPWLLPGPQRDHDPRVTSLTRAGGPGSALGKNRPRPTT